MAQDWDAKQYKKHSKPQFEGALAALGDYSFRGDETVLDIGCGDGKVTKEIAVKVPAGKVVGIDPSANMIKLAQKSFSAINNLSFIQVGAEDYQFDFPFDVIVSFFALHYVKDHEKVLKKIFDSLKTGGIFIVKMAGGSQQDVESVFNKESWKTLLARRDETWHAKTAAEYRPLLEQAGFKNIVTQNESAVRCFDKKEDLFNWAFAWMPYVTGFDQEKAREITQEIVEAIAKGQENNIKMVSPLLYVKAEKSE